VSTITSPLRDLTVTAAISSLKRPAFMAASALFCDLTANFVLLRTGDLPFLGDVLGRGAHVVAVEGVPEAVLDHGVDQLDRGPSSRRCADAGKCGAMLIDSWPPATTTETIAVEDGLVAKRDRPQAPIRRAG